MDSFVCCRAFVKKVLLFALLLCCVAFIPALGLSRAKEKRQLSLVQQRAAAVAKSGAGAGTTTNIQDCITTLDNGWKVVDFSKFRFATKPEGSESGSASESSSRKPEESLKDITSKILTAAQAELAHSTGVQGGSSSTKSTGEVQPPESSSAPRSSKEGTEDKKSTSDTGTESSDSSSKSSERFTVGTGYIVTLTDNPSRLRHAEAMVAKYPELKLSVLPAVTKDSPEALTDWYPLSHGIKLAEKACAQSHIAAIKKVAEAGTKDNELHFIFEDDVQLVPDFMEKFSNYYKATFADGKQPFDIINLWRMPPRVSVATLGAHAIIPDGWWGMQGYVMTSKGAEKILGCVSKRFAQVDEMIGCCAAPTPESATFTGGPLQKHSTRCVYNTPRPVGLNTNLQAFVLQPNLLTHMTSDFKSTAHVN
eukprot:INCI8825.1.p1 GENE.INCI8825.1~~INCI8825.1.p1  ORF type:complete len:422 (+),score=61.91 INCI8825.1:235-1500(+)